MKKILNIALMSVIAIFVFAVKTYAVSDTDVTATLSSETVSPGDTISLTVSIGTVEDGIIGMSGVISWDTTQLTYESKQIGENFSTLNFNNDTTSTSLGTFSVYGDDYITTGGTVFTFTFKVSDDVEENSTIEISITNIKVVSESAGTTSLSSKATSFTVSSSSSSGTNSGTDDNTGTEDGSDSETGTGTEDGTDSETDNSSGTDSDGESGTSTDSDGDAGIDSDGSSTDSDSDTDTDSDGESNTNTDNSTSDNTTNSNTENNSVDNTVSSTILPYTGIKGMLIIGAILILIVCAALFKYNSKIR